MTCMLYSPRGEVIAQVVCVPNTREGNWLVEYGIDIRPYTMYVYLHLLQIDSTAWSVTARDDKDALRKLITTATVHDISKFEQQ